MPLSQVGSVPPFFHHKTPAVPRPTHLPPVEPSTVFMMSHVSTVSLAVLLPLTSRGDWDPVQTIDRVAKLGRSLPGNTGVFIGLDSNDRLVDMKPQLEAALAPCTCRIYEFAPTSPPPIVPIASWLAGRAYTSSQNRYDMFVLLGDDVDILCGPVWVDAVWDAFTEMSLSLGVPLGFGCVALNDLAFPGFPTFPVVSRVHMDIFEGALVPENVFVNQDADPFLWDIYRRWGASMFAPPHVTIRNTIGGDASDEGAPPPRYARVHADWKYGVLAHAVGTIRRWLPSSSSTCIAEHIVMDVIIPTVRSEDSTLDTILALESPPHVQTQFIVIIDPLPNANPGSMAELSNLRRQLETRHGSRVRVRVNPSNAGASGSRNAGLDESSADWVLFLDDDVLPTPTLLAEYANAIKTHGPSSAAGFVGLTTFPRPFPSVVAAGVALSWVTYFWQGAVLAPSLPWGVTANLCTRRTRVRFDTRFPVTGGGEDIAYCAAIRSHLGLPLLGAPSAHATHPWWNNGTPRLSRFFGWAWGDSCLADLFPHHTYRTYPNAVEIAVIAFLIGIVCAVTSQTFSWLATPLALAGLGVGLVDAGWDVYDRVWGPASLAHPEVGGYGLRIVASLCAFVIKTASELGHFWAPFVRTGGGWAHVGRRFDWWMGVGGVVASQAKAEQLVVHRRRFVGFVLVFLLAALSAVSFT